MDHSVITEFKHPNMEYTFVPPRRQAFGLPGPMMHYMTNQNSSAPAYLKLATSCKFFYGKRPILVVDDGFFDTKSKISYMYDTVRWDRKKVGTFKKKLWITGELHIDSYLPVCLNFQFDGHSLILINQKISFEEYLKLVSSKNLAKVDLEMCKIKNAY